MDRVYRNRLYDSFTGLTSPLFLTRVLAGVALPFAKQIPWQLLTSLVLHNTCAVVLQ